MAAGGYNLLPACIEELRPPPPPPRPAQRRAALRLMDQMLRSTLLQVLFSTPTHVLLVRSLPYPA